MFQVIVFDFDGTIADTFEAIVEIYNKIAPKYGLRSVKASEKESIKHLGSRELIKKFMIPTLKIPFLVKEIRSELKKNIQNISLIKGMDKLFKDIERKNIKVGIVTSNSVANVQLFLDKWEITNVDFIHSESSLFGKGKILSRVAHLQEIDKKSIVYVGDEVRDIEAAHNAGIPIIAVTWGFNSKERLNQSKPDYLVTKPQEIVELIQN